MGAGTLPDTLNQDGWDDQIDRNYIKKISFDGTVVANANSSYLFHDFPVLIEISEMNNFDTSNVTNMDRMFANCDSLTSLDLSNFNTSKVTNLSGMFQDSTSLSSLDISNFDTSNVTDMSLMFSHTPLQKINLGSKTKLTNNSNLTSVPNNSNYTGKRQTMGTGTQEYPNGAWSVDTSALSTRSEAGVADTYVWQPVRVAAADVAVKYVDTAGNTIHDPQTISGNVGDAYDATTATYKLAIDGYTLDASQLPTNGTGTLSATAQTVTYVYTKNPVPAADVTVKYVDTAGNTIHDPQTISGNVGEVYDATTATYKLAIDGYTLDASQLPANGTGTLSATAQTVTYVYTKNKNTSHSVPTNHSNPPRRNSSPQASGVSHRIPNVKSASDGLPQTGDNETLSLLAVNLGFLALIGAAIAMVLKRLKKSED